MRGTLCVGGPYAGQRVNRSSHLWAVDVELPGGGTALLRYKKFYVNGVPVYASAHYTSDEVMDMIIRGYETHARVRG